MLLNQENKNLEYNQRLSLPEWEVRRKEILNRDGKMCRSCSSRELLQVHHRQYHIVKFTGKFKDPWSYDQSQLITLCKKCHEAGHHNYKIPVFIVNN